MWDKAKHECIKKNLTLGEIVNDGLTKRYENKDKPKPE